MVLGLRLLYKRLLKYKNIIDLPAIRVYNYYTYYIYRKYKLENILLKRGKNSLFL